MLNYYPRAARTSERAARAFWVDLMEPTDEEKARVEAEYDVRVPSRAQLEEIESSSRLRSEGTALYLSMPLVAQHGDGADAPPGLIGFILSPQLFLTVRYSELRIFNDVRAQIDKHPKNFGSAAAFATLLEAMVDFVADLLEKIGGELGATSRQVFRGPAQERRRVSRATRALREILTAVGDAGEHLSQIRESLLAIQRIVGYTAETAVWLQPEIQTRLKTMRRDVASLTDFETHLSGKVQFLLDAVLGFINTEQNEIFKVLTIVSVVGIPPTLIASMYGMNFHNMPELSWRWGYEYGLTLIAVSTIMPILWFKWRGWW